MSGAADGGACAGCRLWQARLPERSRYGVVQALRQTLGAAVRWGYIGSGNPALVRRTEPPALAARGAGVHARRGGRDQRRTAASLSAAPGVRRCDRAAARGVAGARAPRRGPVLAAGERGADRERWRCVELGKTAGAGGRCRCHAGRSRRSTRWPPGSTPRSCFPPPLAACSTSTTGGGASGDQRSRPAASPARPHLRPALDVRLGRARRCGASVQAGPDHGHVGPHDRTPLRGAARRRRCRHHRPARRSRCGP